MLGVADKDDSKMAIGFVSPGWPLSSYPNGIVAYIYNLIEGLLASECARGVVLTNNVAEEFLDNRSVVNLLSYDHVSPLEKAARKYLWRYLAVEFRCERSLMQSANSILNALKDVSIDLLEIEETFGMAANLQSKTSCPIVTRLHGPWFIHGPILHKDKEDLYNYRVNAELNGIIKSHGITSPSTDVLERVREYYDIELSCAAVIPNPVPVVDVSECWEGGRLAVLFVGRFDLHKGGDLVINAFRIIAQENKDVELLFVGPDHGVIVDGVVLNFYEYLDRFVPESFIKKRVTYLGHCDVDTVAKLRKQAAITVIGSRYENFSLSLVEALVRGCPVIATDVGGNSEIIKDGYNGFLVESNCYEAMAEKVQWLLGQSEVMSSVSKNARTDCIEKYSPIVVARKAYDYYRGVCNDYRV